jgi:hypothetical protein
MLDFDLDSTAAGGAFDRLAVTGVATLAGNVHLRNSLALTDEVFPLVTYASRAGSFAAVTLEEIGTANVAYTAARADFTVTAEEPPPIFISPLMAANYVEWVESVGEAAGAQAVPAANPEIQALRSRAWESDMMADPDRDGSVNLLEYAFQTDPLDPASRASFDLGPDPLRPGCLLVTSRMREGATDIRYVVESSLDSRIWSELDGGLPPVIEMAHAPLSPGIETLRIAIDRPGTAARFFRLSVQTVNP